MLGLLLWVEESPEMIVLSLLSKSQHLFLKIVHEYFLFILQISYCVLPKPSSCYFPPFLIVSWTQATLLWKVTLIPIIKDLP
jgi:hypothetical protein